MLDLYMEEFLSTFCWWILELISSDAFFLSRKIFLINIKKINICSQTSFGYSWGKGSHFVNQPDFFLHLTWEWKEEQCSYWHCGLHNVNTYKPTQVYRLWHYADNHVSINTVPLTILKLYAKIKTCSGFVYKVGPVSSTKTLVFYILTEESINSHIWSQFRSCWWVIQ